MAHNTADTRAEDAASTELLKTQNHVLKMVAQGAPLHLTLTALLSAIEDQLPDTLSSILLLDDDGVHVRHGAAPSLPASYIQGIDGQAIGPDAGSCGTAAYRREPVIVEDIATDPLWARYRDFALPHGLRACWSTPIFDGQRRVLGTFALYHRTPTRPSDHMRDIVDATIYTAAIVITEHRAAEQRRQREAQFEQAERIAQLGSYVWDPQADRVLRSKELARIFGLPLAEFAPTFEAYLERVHPEDRAHTRAMIERAVQERQPFEFEERIVRPDGSVRHLHSQGKWIEDAEAGTFKLIGICHDITERKRADERVRRVEALRVRNEELTAFAYMVSHDLKAPIRGVAGYARELATEHRAGLSDRGIRCVDEILACTHDLDRLIEDLLQYSRLDAETATPRIVDLRQVIERVLLDRAAAIGAHGTHVDLDLRVTRLCIWERGLTQILSNLIDNAVKFSKQAASPRVRIASEDAGDAVRITVADNGIGFDMKHHDRLFVLFHRLVGRDRFEGTGAGLAIVKKMADKIGGRVHAVSSPGAGATFVFELPKIEACT